MTRSKEYKTTLVKPEASIGGGGWLSRRSGGGEARGTAPNRGDGVGGGSVMGKSQILPIGLDQLIGKAHLIELSGQLNNSTD
jgi:hypothetical protein